MWKIDNRCCDLDMFNFIEYKREPAASSTIQPLIFGSQRAFKPLLSTPYLNHLLWAVSITYHRSLLSGNYIMTATSMGLFVLYHNNLRPDCLRYLFKQQIHIILALCLNFWCYLSSNMIGLSYV